MTACTYLPAFVSHECPLQRTWYSLGITAIGRGFERVVTGGIGDDGSDTITLHWISSSAWIESTTTGHT